MDPMNSRDVLPKMFQGWGRVGHVGVGWGGSCRGGVGHAGVGWVIQGWGGSCRGGVSHAGVGGS